MPCFKLVHLELKPILNPFLIPPKMNVGHSDQLSMTSKHHSVVGVEIVCRVAGNLHCG